MNTGLHVVQLLPTLRTGGAERLVTDLSTCLQTHGVRVTIVTMFGPENTPYEQRVEEAGIPHRWLNKRFGLDLRMPVRISRTLRELRPDVLHTHLYTLRYAAPALPVNRIPAVLYTLHSIPRKEDNMLGLLINWLAFRFRLVQPVAISPTIAAAARSLYGARINFPVIRNGIQMPPFLAVKNAGQRKRNRFVLLNVGRLTDVKNQQFLLRIALRLQALGLDFELRFAGDGPLRQALEEQARILSVESKVKFLGSVSDMAAVYGDADIFVLPSLYEGLPIALLEAMASALPVVASAVGGVPDVIHDGRTGILLPPGDESAWATVIHQLATSPELRKKLGSAAREEVVARYDIGSTTRAYLELYHKLLRAKGHRG